MTRLFKRTAEKVAQSPGTLQFTGKKHAEEVAITVTSYDAETLDETTIGQVESCFPDPDSNRVHWINVNGLHDVDVIRKFGEHFNLHPLVLEDIVNTSQRSKVEEYEGYLFITSRMLYYSPGDDVIQNEQVSVIVGPNYVISLQERPGDVFEPVRERIRSARGRIRHLGPDYLAYALIDAIVDHYFVILEQLATQIEELEERLVDSPSPEHLHQIHEYKRETVYLRGAVTPLREVTVTLGRGESKLIHEDTIVFLRDLYDHTVQVIDAVSSFRDLLSGLQDLYLSSVSNRMNEVMKVLTIIATIFVPLTFIAGIYGMNFQYMPELGMRWGYPTLWAVFIVLAGIMIAYFRKQRWL